MERTVTITWSGLPLKMTKAQHQVLELLRDEFEDEAVIDVLENELWFGHDTQPVLDNLDSARALFRSY